MAVVGSAILQLGLRMSASGKLRLPFRIRGKRLPPAQLFNSRHNEPGRFVRGAAVHLP